MVQTRKPVGVGMLNGLGDVPDDEGRQLRAVIFDLVDLKADGGQLVADFRQRRPWCRDAA